VGELQVRDIRVAREEPNVTVPLNAELLVDRLCRAEEAAALVVDAVSPLISEAVPGSDRARGFP